MIAATNQTQQSRISYLLALVILTAFALPQTARASLLISHTFDGTGALSGTSLDVNNVGASTWNANTGITADGEMSIPTWNTKQSAYVDLGATTIGMGAPDDIYTLDVVVDGKMRGNSWFTGGLWEADPGTSANHDFNGSPYFAWSKVGGNVTGNTGNLLPVADHQFFTQADLLSPAGVNYEKFTLVFDLTDATLVNNTATLYINDSFIASGNFSGEEGFRYVGIGGRNVDIDGSGIADVQRLTLTQIPEPTTIGMFGFFGALLVLIRRRRRA